MNLRAVPDQTTDRTAETRTNDESEVKSNGQHNPVWHLRMLRLNEGACGCPCSLCMDEAGQCRCPDCGCPARGA